MKPRLLLFLACLFVTTATGQNRQLPTIDQILERYVQSLGGEAALRKVTTRVGKGTFEAQGGKVKGRLELIAQAPNRQLLRFEGEAPDGKAFDVLSGFDGTTRWTLDLVDGEFSELSRAELATQRLDAEFYREIKLKELYPKMQFDGEQSLGTRRAYVITATSVEGRAEKFYFDVLSGLLIRADRLATQPSDTYTAWFEDYREVDGIKLPFTIRTNAGDFVSRFDEIKHNMPVEAARFSKADPALAAATTDEYLQAEMKKRRIPGLALAVVKNGEIVKVQGHGLANLEHDAPVTPDTVFELASVTKQFTATAIMRLYEQGKLKLDDPINKYLPAAPGKWKDITIRHLLTHTGGIVSLEEGFADLYDKMDISTEESFRSVAKDPLSFAPGERHQYSDAGYFLLGMIIEKASGQRYRHFLREQFFSPLAMTATSILDQWAAIKQRAAGYTLRNGELINIRRIWQVELPSYYGVLSTVRDLAQWDIALAAGKVVSEASLKAMWTPAKLNNGKTYPYGFGWEIEQMGDHRVITHSGVSGTEYTRLPDDKLTVIILTNLGDRGLDAVNAWGLTKGVARRYLAGRP
jgi:CubicO group peptidase (beta-lactamase class C family)